MPTSPGSTSSTTTGAATSATSWAGLAEQAGQIPLPHAFQPGDLDGVVHADAVNRKGHFSDTAVGGPFRFTRPVADMTAPVTNPCIG